MNTYMQFHYTHRTSFSHTPPSTPHITSITHTDHPAHLILPRTSHSFRQLPSYITPIHIMYYFLFFLLLSSSFFFVLLHFASFLLFLIFFFALLYLLALLLSSSVFFFLDLYCSVTLHSTIHSTNTTYIIHKYIHTQLHNYIII